MITVCKKFHFDAAHKLPHYIGSCANLHGHRWELEIEMFGEIKDEGNWQGMIVDFSELKNKIEKEVLCYYDHHFLNDICPNPTAENIVFILAERIKIMLWGNLTLVRVRLYESPDSWAEWKN